MTIITPPIVIELIKRITVSIIASTYEKIYILLIIKATL